MLLINGKLVFNIKLYVFISIMILYQYFLISPLFCYNRCSDSPEPIITHWRLSIVFHILTVLVYWKTFIYTSIYCGMMHHDQSGDIFWWLYSQSRKLCTLSFKEQNCSYWIIYNSIYGFIGVLFLTLSSSFGQGISTHFS